MMKELGFIALYLIIAMTCGNIMEAAAETYHGEYLVHDWISFSILVLVNYRILVAMSRYFHRKPDTELE